MNSTSLRHQIAFIREIEKLKSVQRMNRTLDGRWENSAEHSWHAALMACLLEEHAGGRLDMLKVVKMLLVHDLVEIDAGDTWLFAADQSAKAPAEAAAAERLYALLPDGQGERYHALWREFEEGETAEARFAIAMDGIQSLVNHLLTGRPEDGTLSVEEVRRKKKHIQEYAPGLSALVEELIRDGEALGLYT